MSLEVDDGKLILSLRSEVIATDCPFQATNSLTHIVVQFFHTSVQI